MATGFNEVHQEAKVGNTLANTNRRPSSARPSSRIGAPAFDPTAIHHALLSDGFAKLAGCISRQDVAVMKIESERLLDGNPQRWQSYTGYAKAGQWHPLLLAEAGRNTNLLDFLGESEQLDQFANELLARPDLNELLRRILGTGYRMWYAQIRRAELNAAPLRMHQDIPGEVGFGILLDEIDSHGGSTVFVKGSHRWPRLFSTFPFLSPNSIKRFLTAVVGSPGDCYMFYNCTLHGAASATKEPRMAIIFTFLPESAQQTQRRPPPELLNRLGSHLQAALKGDEVNSAGNVVTDAIGPDEIVSEQRKFSMLSPWRAAMLAAGTFDSVMSVYRRLRNTSNSST